MGHTTSCEEVEIGDQVFAGHLVMFVHDKFPNAMNEAGVVAGVPARAGLP